MSRISRSNTSHITVWMEVYRYVISPMTNQVMASYFAGFHLPKECRCDKLKGRPGESHLRYWWCVTAPSNVSAPFWSRRWPAFSIKRRMELSRNATKMLSLSFGAVSRWTFLESEQPRWILGWERWGLQGWRECATMNVRKSFVEEKAVSDGIDSSLWHCPTLWWRRKGGRRVCWNGDNQEEREDEKDPESARLTEYGKWQTVSIPTHL